MRGLWGNFWFRSLVAVGAALPTCLLGIWLASYVTAWLVQVWRLPGIGTGDVLFTFDPSMFLGAVAALPFWGAAEPRLWGRRTPLPLGSYIIFFIAFFPILFTFLFVLMSARLSNQILNLGLMLALYAGAAFIAGGIGYCYYYFWRRQQDRLPPIIPDVF